ncbi:hypothetical protein OSB04_008027 [Centaurea solstitialis]|uniref:Uncharacterized protein n=1 Tax=Centaurea solstitialis TaxID=347529 RepID=A0AA38WJ25_9ASTR|nr:hypothetical protein OSB04_008027 [Centaurea solstitialis]
MIAGRKVAVDDPRVSSQEGFGGASLRRYLRPAVPLLRPLYPGKQTPKGESASLGLPYFPPVTSGLAMLSGQAFSTRLTLNPTRTRHDTTRHNTFARSSNFVWQSFDYPTTPCYSVRASGSEVPISSSAGLP